MKGFALFALAAIAVTCAANQGCSQRVIDDQEAAEAMARANAAQQADRQKAESVRQQQLADDAQALAQANAREDSALSIETICQQSTLYWGSIAQARDNGVSLNKVLHTINDQTGMWAEDADLQTIQRMGMAEESKTARYIYRHREISPVKFQDRAYRECVESDRRYRLKAKKDEEEQLKLPGINTMPSPLPSPSP